MAASLSEQYICYEDLLYERARRYIEAAEMKASRILFSSYPVADKYLGSWRNICLYISCPDVGSYCNVGGKEDLFLTIMDEHWKDGSLSTDARVL